MCERESVSVFVSVCVNVRVCVSLCVCAEVSQQLFNAQKDGLNPFNISALKQTFTKTPAMLFYTKHTQTSAI